MKYPFTLLLFCIAIIFLIQSHHYIGVLFCIVVFYYRTHHIEMVFLMIILFCYVLIQQLPVSNTYKITQWTKQGMIAESFIQKIYIQHPQKIPIDTTIYVDSFSPMEQPKSLYHFTYEQYLSNQGIRYKTNRYQVLHSSWTFRNQLHQWIHTKPIIYQPILELTLLGFQQEQSEKGLFFEMRFTISMFLYLLFPFKQHKGYPLFFLGGLGFCYLCYGWNISLCFYGIVFLADCFHFKNRYFWGFYFVLIIYPYVIHQFWFWMLLFLFYRKSFQPFDRLLYYGSSIVFFQSVSIVRIVLYRYLRGLVIIRWLCCWIYLGCGFSFLLDWGFRLDHALSFFSFMNYPISLMMVGTWIFLIICLMNYRKPLWLLLLYAVCWFGLGMHLLCDMTFVSAIPKSYRFYARFGEMIEGYNEKAVLLEKSIWTKSFVSKGMIINEHIQWMRHGGRLFLLIDQPDKKQLQQFYQQYAFEKPDYVFVVGHDIAWLDDRFMQYIQPKMVIFMMNRLPKTNKLSLLHRYQVDILTFQHDQDYVIYHFFGIDLIFGRSTLVIRI